MGPYVTFKSLTDKYLHFLIIFFFFFSKGPFYKNTLQMNTYVALYKFVPQENEDLEMR